MIEKDGKDIFAYECKWKEKTDEPISFKTAYPDAHFQCVTTENIVAHFTASTPISPN